MSSKKQLWPPKGTSYTATFHGWRSKSGVKRVGPSQAAPPSHWLTSFETNFFYFLIKTMLMIPFRVIQVIRHNGIINNI